MDTKTIFADGFFFDRPRDGAPEFVKGRMSIKVAEAVPFLQANVNEAGYVNLDLKLSREGKLYLQLNTYKPAAKDDVVPEPVPVVEKSEGEKAYDRARNVDLDARDVGF